MVRSPWDWEAVLSNTSYIHTESGVIHDATLSKLDTKVVELFLGPCKVYNIAFEAWNKFTHSPVYDRFQHPIRVFVYYLGRITFWRSCDLRFDNIYFSVSRAALDIESMSLRAEGGPKEMNAGGVLTHTGAHARNFVRIYYSTDTAVT